MDDHHRKSADLPEGHKNPPSESASAEFTGEHFLNDISFDFGAADARGNLDASQHGRRQSQRLNTNLNKRRRTDNESYGTRSFDIFPLIEQINKSLTQIVEKREQGNDNTLKEMANSLKEITNSLTVMDKSHHERVDRLEQELREIKEQRATPSYLPAVPSYAQKAAQGPQMVPSKKAITLTLHQTDPTKPVLSENETKSADIKRIMDEHISKTFGDRLNITEHFISAAKRLPTNSFKLQAQDSKVAMELRNCAEWVPQGLRHHVDTHEVAVLRVPTSSDPSDIAKQLEAENLMWKNKVVYAKWAKRSAKKQQFATLKVQLSDVNAAKASVSLNVGYNGEIMRVEPANLIPRQCLKCGKLRHTQKVCRSPPRCMRCAEEHETEKCKKAPCANAQEGTRGVACSRLNMCTHYTTKKCSNCPENESEGHTALEGDKCPIKKSYLESIAQQNREKKELLLGMSWGARGGNSSGSDPAQRSLE